ncbi:hypothetical protein CMI37_37680 [Candidatus Pacearchaeota archaeon]|nr:hypothetical protein [Candidatus Pacearchaeota archaeon]|tara:strand:- start:2451 stop:6290 length:3840 start_codon:yes stop_codon:yes gene_type:complete
MTDPINFREACEAHRRLSRDKSAYVRGIYEDARSEDKSELTVAVERGYTEIDSYHTEGDKDRAENLTNKVHKAEVRGLKDGSFDLTPTNNKRLYDNLTRGISDRDREIIGSFDPDRDADLIANYLFAIDEDIREKLGDVKYMYDVSLRLGSKKKKSGPAEGKGGNYEDEGNSNSNNNLDVEGIISGNLEDAIRNVPRDVYAGSEEYQRRLRVLFQKKAERDAFPRFRKDQDAVFAYLDRRINEEENENLVDSYIDLKETYKGYTEFNPEGANSDFVDPDTGENGVLPSLHQKIALYHMIKEKRFGVFDGCGTGKTAIATLAQPLIEARLNEEGKEFKRTVIVGPNPSKKAWKNGLEGELHQRYLAESQDTAVINEDHVIVNGEKIKKTDKRFIQALKDSKWIVVNYDQLPREINGSNKSLVDHLIDIEFDYVIFDEGHQIKAHKEVTKNGNLTRSGAARRLARNSEYLTILTGSPIPDSMDDYAVLFSLLNPEECSDPTKFKQMYDENPRALYTFLNNKTIRRTSEDINEHLEFEESNELVDVSSEQEKIYLNLLEFRSKDWLTQARKSLLDPRLTDPAVLRRVGLLGKVGYEHSAKYQKLEELLLSDDGPVAKGENFVIFSSMFREGVTRAGHEDLKRRYIELGVEEEFDDLGSLEERILVRSLDGNLDSISSLKKKFTPKSSDEELKQEFENEFDNAITELTNKGYISRDEDKVTVNTLRRGPVSKHMDLYESLGFDVPLIEKLETKLEEKYGRTHKIGVIDGKIGEIEERESIVDQLGNSLTGILCTTDTGGESLDFTSANHLYFLDRDYKPKTEEQAIARAVRKGQDKEVFITHLIANYADEVLEDYVRKKKIIIKTAVDGHPISSDEKAFLEDKKGSLFGEDLIRRAGLGGKSINMLEAEVDSIDFFSTKKKTRGFARNVNRSSIDYETTEAQELMRWIGRDPNCWKDPEFVKEYERLINELSVPVIHRAKITDLIRRTNNKQIVFPRKIVSEGSGNSILFDAYHDLSHLLKGVSLRMPTIFDRDVSKAMLEVGNNPNQVLGCMTGRNSQFGEREFNMVDNASISLLANSKDVKKSLLEAHRILKNKGLLELTVEGKQFYDGRSIPEEERIGSLASPSFYAGLESLGFELLSEKNEGFDLNRNSFRTLKNKLGAQFAEAYRNKLANSQFILARKIDNPVENINSENFWFYYPKALKREDGDNGSNNNGDEGDIRDPAESRSILTPGRSRRNGRVRTKNGKPVAFENDEVVNPKRKMTVAPNGVVESVEDIGGGE